MAEIDKQTTEKAKKLLRVQYGINEHYNPLVRIPADLYRYPLIWSVLYTWSENSFLAPISRALTVGEEVWVVFFVLLDKPKQSFPVTWFSRQKKMIDYHYHSAKAILTFLHRWQMNLHKQSWPCTFHTTKEILFVKTKRWRRWARLTASRWLTLRGWNLLWSMSIHRQTNSTVKRQLRKCPWLEKYSYLLKSWISLFLVSRQGVTHWKVTDTRPKSGWVG